MRLILAKRLCINSNEKSGYLVYHFDQLGSTKCITDKDGKTVYTMSYGSYGELFGIQDAKGKLVNFKDNPIAFLYNGQYGIVTDQNTLLYMRARYYNPEIKRFLNQDVLTGSIGNSQSLNRYSYVQGNPIRFTDPFGLCPNGSGTLSEFTPAAKKVLGLAHLAYDYFYEMTWQEQTHLACAVLGFVPGVGDVADVVDGYAYSTEGNLAEAAFSYGCAAAGIVPGADQVAALGKLLRVLDNVFGGVKAADKILEARSIIKISSNIEDFAGIGHEGTYLFDLAKGTEIANKATDGAKVASHAADGIKAADNSIDAVRSTSNIGEAIVKGGKPSGVTFEGRIYRSVKSNYDPLEMNAKTIDANHRYTGVGVPGLYFSSGEKIVNAELSNYDIFDFSGRTMYSYDVTLNNMLDVSNPLVRSQLGISLESIVGNSYDVTHSIGRFAFDNGYNGIIAPSARADGGVNIILFNVKEIK